MKIKSERQPLKQFEPFELLDVQLDTVRRTLNDYDKLSLVNDWL